MRGNQLICQIWWKFEKDILLFFLILPDFPRDRQLIRLKLHAKVGATIFHFTIWPDARKPAHGNGAVSNTYSDTPTHGYGARWPRLPGFENANIWKKIYAGCPQKSFFLIFLWHRRYHRYSFEISTQYKEHLGVLLTI